MQISASKVWFENEKIFVELKDKRVVGVPIECYPKLKNATAEQRCEFELWEHGRWIHWEKLDEDLSVAGFLNPRIDHPKSLSP